MKTVLNRDGGKERNSRLNYLRSKHEHLSTASSPEPSIVDPRVVVNDKPDHRNLTGLRMRR